MKSSDPYFEQILDRVKEFATQLLLRRYLASSLASGRGIFESDAEELRTLAVAYENLGARLKTGLQTAARIIWNHRNTTVFIHRLPPEILLRVFGLVLGPRDMGRADYALNYCRQRNTLAIVSMAWRNLIQETQEFWRICSEHLPLKENCKHLLRSAGRTIDVQFLNIERDNAFWLLLRPELSRCLRLKASASKILLETLNQGAPLLQELDLDGIEDWFEFRPSWRKQSFPRLRQLKLKGLKLPWTKPLFSNLTVIHFDSIMDLKLSLLLHMLEMSRFLCEVALISSKFDSQDHCWDGSVLHLPRLKALRLLGLIPEVVVQLAAKINPGKLSTLEIDSHGSGTREDLSIYQEPPPYFRETLIDFVARTPLVEIDNNSSFRLWCGDRAGNSLVLCGPREAAPTWCLEIFDQTGHPKLLNIILGSLNSLTRVSQRFRHSPCDIDLNLNLKKTSKKLEAFCRTRRDGSWMLPRASVIRFYLRLEQVKPVALLLRTRYESSNLTPPRTIIYRSEIPYPEFSNLLQESPALINCKIYRRQWEGSDTDGLELVTPFAQSYGLELLDR